MLPGVNNKPLRRILAEALAEGQHVHGFWEYRIYCTGFPVCPGASDPLPALTPTPSSLAEPELSEGAGSRTGSGSDHDHLLPGSESSPGLESSPYHDHLEQREDESIQDHLPKWGPIELVRAEDVGVGDLILQEKLGTYHEVSQIWWDTYSPKDHRKKTIMIWLADQDPQTVPRIYDADNSVAIRARRPTEAVHVPEDAQISEVHVVGSPGLHPDQPDPKPVNNACKGFVPKSGFGFSDICDRCGTNLARHPVVRQ